VTFSGGLTGAGCAVLRGTTVGGAGEDDGSISIGTLLVGKSSNISPFLFPWLLGLVDEGTLAADGGAATVDPRRRADLAATGGGGDIRPGPTRADRSISSSSSSVEDMQATDESMKTGRWPQLGTTEPAKQVVN
jgi:hypothetical protein